MSFKYRVDVFCEVAGDVATGPRPLGDRPFSEIQSLSRIGGSLSEKMGSYIQGMPVGSRQRARAVELKGRLEVVKTRIQVVEEAKRA